MAKTIWAYDPTHSEIGFKVKHMMFTNVSGNFSAFNAMVETESEDFQNAAVQFSADVASVSTGNEQRDGHLKGADFFDAENHPKMSFSSTAFRKSGDGNYELEGNLTLRGVTQPVKLAVEYGGQDKDPWGNLKAGFSVNGKINRKDFGLNWNAALEAGGVLVSDEVKIHAELQFVKQA
jgi:polyisoprenoid-binding protein YceI